VTRSPQSRRFCFTGERRRAISVLLLASFAIHGCGYAHRNVAEPHGRIVPPAAADSTAVLKVHLRDGSLVILDHWRVLEAPTSAAPIDTLIGAGTRYDPARHPTRVDEVRLASTEVVLIETNRAGISVGRSLAAVVIVVAATLSTIVLAKALFGSCPTFYVTDGHRPVLMAEGFSASVLPQLEATDVDALWRAGPHGRRVEVLMRNEALETHVVRSLRLLAIPRGDGRVIQTMDGEFRRVSAQRAPLHAWAAEGDVAQRLAAVDGEERFSLTDSTDLAAHERIILDFGEARGDRRGLVIAHRQSLVMTYLLYQALAWMGSSAGEHIANLERGGSGFLDLAQGAGQMLGPIEVQVREPGRDWHTVGTVDETGPIATDVHLVPLPVLTPDTEVGLWIARGHWRLDAVSLVTIGDRVEPIGIEPVVAVRDSLTGPRADRAALGGVPLVTMPGQSVIYRFELPWRAEECELFLESRGYYLEWIREFWLDDEDPAALAGFVMDPRGTLRRLAPAYKAQESQLERAFWGSRVAHP